ncbi:low molecular weight phosphotyrosine protein phosphatase [Shimia sp.]|uniref:arsenate reductase/protein-tyrosine-phosphatase family protein n=1 Tax=Shimia sp. TaxID=1954381 RepID=UPI003565EEDC
MFNNILVVCVGNICRSPLGERLLQAKVPGLNVSSAGIGALVGKPADETASQVAAEHGISLDGHSARQASAEILTGAELILVMESGHKAAIAQIAPQVSGRVMLADHWIGGKGVADPYRHSKEFHQLVFTQLDSAMDAWAQRLAAK